VGKDAENHDRKTQSKNSELNSAWESNAERPIKRYTILTRGKRTGHWPNP
jgi:hypothetical protein